MQEERFPSRMRRCTGKTWHCAVQVLGTCVGGHPDVSVLSNTLLQAFQGLQHHRYTFFPRHPQHITLAAQNISTACMPYVKLPNPMLFAALGVGRCIIAHLSDKVNLPVCRACGHCIHCCFHHSFCGKNWSPGQGFLPRT